MRRLVVIACVALAAAAAPAEAGARVLVAYLPADGEQVRTLLQDLTGRGLSYGLASPTLGGYAKRQLVLDIGQGSRISTRAYDVPVPFLRLVPRRRGGYRIAHWAAAVKRADAAPGDAVPGLLAQTVEDAGGRVAYAGVIGFEQIEAVSAADRHGRVAEARFTTLGRLAATVSGLWRDHDLVVARLPENADGLAVLDRLLRVRRPSDLVIVMRAPPSGGLRLLALAAAGPGFEGGRLTSATTRLAGFVAATDLAPTVLEHLGLGVPGQMSGRPLADEPGGSPDGVRSLGRRFDVIVGRRMPVLRAALAALLLLLVALAALRRRAGLHAWLRLALLAALWLPGLALVTGALRPSRGAEVAVLVLGSLLLAAATDRALPWPRGPALPVAVVFVAHAIDLAAGSALVDASLAGPNPKGGARFYGIGNELETMLALGVLVGTGAAVARRQGPPAARAFAGAAIVAGLVIGAGRLGADVGGVITLGAGGAAAVVAALAAGQGELGRRALVLALLAPALAVAALVAVDLVTAGGAHLTRSVIEARGPGDIVDIVDRRFRISFGEAATGRAPVSVGLALVVIVLGAAFRRRILAPLEGEPGLRAAIVGGWFATVVGALANDSGPMILLIGTLGLVLAVGYARGRPPGGRLP